MAGDQVNFFNRLVQHFRSFLSYVEVAGAVCTIATNAVVTVQAVRQGVQVGFFRHGLVERGVEHGNVFIRQFREGFQCLSDTDQVCWVMQWCKWHRIFDTLQDFVIDYGRRSELLAAVHNAVTDSGQLCRKLRFCARIVLTM